MHVDMLVVNAGAIATMRGPPGPRRGRALGDPDLLSNGAVAIRDGTIVAVGRSSTLRTRFQATRTLDAEGGLVTPGFVDPHTHLPFAGDRSFELALKLAGRSYESIQRGGGGIHRTVRETRRASLEDLVQQVKPRTRTMLVWGTTTAEAKSGYGLSLAQEVKQLEAVRRASRANGVELVPTFLGAHVVPPERASKRAAWIQEIAHRIIPRIAAEQRAEFVDVFVERTAYRPAEAKTILASARAHGLGLKLHADEFTNQKAAELGADLGATSCDHLLEISKIGIRRIARSPTVAVLLPGVAVLGFLDHQAPARNLVQAGAAIALGTDFNPNCPVLTMPTILQWGVYGLRLTPGEALAAATTNAAYAIGRGDRVGRVAVGYQADLLIHHYDAIEDLAYWVGPNPVRLVLKRGRIVGPRSA